MGPWLWVIGGCGGPTTAPTDDPSATDDPPDTDTVPPPATGDTGAEVALPDVPVALTLLPDFGSVVVARWDQPIAATTRVEYRVDGEDWRSSPDTARDVGPAEQLLFGVPYAASASVRVVWDVPNGSTGSESLVVTADLPAGFPVPTLLSADPARSWQDEWILGSINGVDGGWTRGPYWMFVVDRQGRIVWTKPGIDDHFTIYLHVSLDNDILWDESTFWAEFDGGATSKIHRMKLDGTELEVLDAPGMHHCFLEMPDRSIVWGSAHGMTSEQLLRRYPDGSVVTEWDCDPFYATLGLTDWCHTNSIVYDALTDRYLLSFPTDETFVLEVDTTTHEEVRWFGHIPGSWAFDAPSSAFQYQHGVTWTDARTLLMSSQRTDRDHDALVREYTLDEATETLTQIWSFGAGDGIEADNAGEAHRLPNGNTLHNTGTTPRIREITADGAVVWDLSWEGSKLLGRTVFVPDLYALAP